MYTNKAILFNKKCSFNILVLRNFCGDAYPIDIINLINSFYLELFNPGLLVRNNIPEISCGGRHTAIITLDNKMYVWGNNWDGQLGLGDHNNRNLPEKININNIMSVNCGSEHTVAITTNEFEESQLYSWGLR